ncbi:tRNA-dihydrouridine synthase family protein [Labilibacter sediminis]|nr:tRNA-dihydrouridine synthase family protein [Labilibacter sediminis]
MFTSSPLNSFIYFAPLQSYTTLPYYLSYAQVFNAVDKYFTPFYRKNKKDVFEYEDELKCYDGLNIIPQVLVNNSKDLIQFTTDMMKKGFGEINLNMGCPFPMVANKRLGSGFLPYRDKYKLVLKEYFSQNLPMRLSIKTRLGWDNKEEVIALTEVVNDFPIQELIVHPRLGTQKYTGDPDWDVFKEVLEVSNHQVVGNGDINSSEDLETLQKKFPHVEVWMLGRGLLSKPDMLQPGISRFQQKQNLICLHDNFYDNLKKFGYLEGQILNHLKTFWEYPLQDAEGGKRIHRKLRKVGKLDAYSEIKKMIFDLI